MKRHADLFDAIVDFQSLWRAAHRAALGKRYTPVVARFTADLEHELLGLRRDLGDGTYRPGAYRTFVIRDPKERLISVAPFRDRVVHHAVCAAIEPILDRTLTADTFANRQGMGTLRALDRFQELTRRHRWVLVADVRKYFASIDHAVLKALLRRKFKEPRLLALLDAIIDGSNDQEPVFEHFPGDGLLAPIERRRGLPIGNLTSQTFANAYLGGFDHFVKEGLGVPGYCRYMDDFALFGDDRATVAGWREEVVRFLAGLRLKVHDRKTRLRDTREGLPFLGFVVVRERRRLRGQAVHRAARRMRGQRAGLRSGAADVVAVGRSVRAWVEHAGHGDTSRLRQDLFRRLWGPAEP
jgi:hypothetical protein